MGIFSNVMGNSRDRRNIGIGFMQRMREMGTVKRNKRVGCQVPFERKIWKMRN